MQQTVCVQDVGFGYSPFPHALSRDPGISLQAKGLYAVLGSFVSATDPTAWPSRDYLAKLCGLNRGTLQKYKRELLKTGWISEEQRHNGVGQYSTLVVTRYFHPSLNSEFPIKSTVAGKAVRGKTDPKQEPLETPTKKHTQQRESVCVNEVSPTTPNAPPTNDPDGKSLPVEDAPSAPPEKVYSLPMEKASTLKPGGNGKVHEITQEQRACIEWTVLEMVKAGQLKNEIALRCYLVKAAKNGELEMSGYLAHLEQKKNGHRASNEVISKVEQWKREAEEAPITHSFMARMKEEHPALFR